MMIAIDPGAAGGIAWMDKELGAQACALPATVTDRADMLRSLRVAGGRTVVIEQVPMFGGKNPSASAKIARSFGELVGIVTALGFRLELWTPQAWQKQLRLGNKATHGPRWKAHLKERAQALFPHLTVTLKTADALLILEAAQQ